MDLGAVQRELEAIYDVRAGSPVDDFLITDSRLARRLDSSPHAREVDEKLLVRQDGDELRISLYLSDELISRLQEDDPFDLLHGGNVADLCAAVEGVSHFVYVAWRAGHDRPVTRTELEMQAEVDKFVTITRLLAKQGSGHPTRLHAWLFRVASFDPSLTDPDRRLYHRANDLAARYCRRLETQYLGRDHPAGAGFYADLRRFYRLGHPHKIDHAKGL